MPNLVFLTRRSLQILDKTQNNSISDFQISGQSHVKGNCHNSRTSDDTDIKLGPINELDKTQLFKSISQIIPEFMWSFFNQRKISYNLKKGPIPNVPKTRSTYYSINVVHFRGFLVWNNLPAEIKSRNSIFEFKTKVRNMGNIECLICWQFLYVSI